MRSSGVCICMCSVTLSDDLGPAPFPYGASVQLAPLSNQHCSIKAVEKGVQPQWAGSGSAVRFSC